MSRRSEVRAEAAPVEVFLGAALVEPVHEGNVAVGESGHVAPQIIQADPGEEFPSPPTAPLRAQPPQSPNRMSNGPQTRQGLDQAILPFRVTART